MKSWTTAKVGLYIAIVQRLWGLSDIKLLTMMIMRLLLHDNKGIKDKFTPHTPYPAIVCLLGGPRVTRICHFNLLTSRSDKGIQFESQCKLMKLRRVHEMNILACYHLQTRYFLRRHVSTSALYPCSLIPSSSRVKDLILSLSGLNSWIGYTQQSQHSNTITTVGWTVRLDLKKKYWKLIVLVASSIVSEQSTME